MSEKMKKEIKVGDIVRILEDEGLVKLTKGKLARVMGVFETCLVVKELQNPFRGESWRTKEKNVELVEESETGNLLVKELENPPKQKKTKASKPLVKIGDIN
ncbi:MAG: hypothetical protein M0Q88_00125 [Bacilli bacterium]|nr:hypothetical protein [Bacilli bacterium]